jgi:hypothetical protein
MPRNIPAKSQRKPHISAIFGAIALLVGGRGTINFLFDMVHQSIAVTTAAGKIRKACDPADVSEKPIDYTYISFWGTEYPANVKVSVTGWRKFDETPIAPAGVEFDMHATDSFTGISWDFTITPTNCRRIREPRPGAG